MSVRSGGAASSVPSDLNSEVDEYDAIMKYELLLAHQAENDKQQKALDAKATLKVELLKQ